MASFEALYGRKYRTPKLVGTDLIHETEDKVRVIRECLKVSLKQKVLRFGRKGKLSPRFIGPYEIIEIVGPVAYRLALPFELEKIHNVFHVSMLRQCRSDPSHPNLTYSEELVKILAWEVQKLRNKLVLLVKVLWHRHGTKEATWETEELMKLQYLNLFSHS
ncbi:DNA/RNA polymerases superfamily protein [Gossypium australe]|uniref:DNA/RNA polymerases superfamily protein n=1 Tax=Gossypium australe TaxID=47621 RepID=A0A5B6WP96_9ROSI|nr:DNA/RNA polymerases superfamily protein [Gossypium australe]